MCLRRVRIIKPNEMIFGHINVLKYLSTRQKKFNECKKLTERTFCPHINGLFSEFKFEIDSFLLEISYLVFRAG